MPAGDLDPDEVGTVEQLAELLRRLHVRAGKKSYRDLERWSAEQRKAGRVAVLLSRATITDALNGRRLPKKDFLRSFVEACEVPAEQRASWIAAWERVAEGRLAVAPANASADDRPAEPVALRSENARLRDQLAAARDELDKLRNAQPAGARRNRPARRRVAIAMVEALDRCGFVRSRPGLELFIEEVRREVPGALIMRDQPSVRAQLIELVTKCLDIDGGVEAIADCVELLEPGSLGSEAVRLAAAEWTPGG